MGVEHLQQLLKESIGIDAASIGVSAIERALRIRGGATGALEPDAYAERVRSSSAELDEFIDAVVVPETWFFRDPGALAALTELALRRCAAQGPATMLRLLSLPCSTGEEPYSMAMALLDGGMPPHQFHIDGVDISERLLVRARTGVYGRGSFRGADLAFRERHFAATADGYRISDRARQQVTFRRGNLVAPDLSRGERYDFVFCRNLLIYFDAATQDRALANLAALLKPDAYLFVGAAETGLLWEREFRSSRVGAAFIFQKGRRLRSSTQSTMPAPVSGPAGISPPARPIDLTALGLTHDRRRPAPVRRSALAGPAPTLLQQARTQADEGHFVEAARLCEQHLREKGPTAEAYYLLGLVRDASGNEDDAVVHYRKALYLEPQHGDALLHLALLLDRQGQTAAAQVLRNRARRADLSRTS
jgi:chemotaxis protein methyltransferase WspC